MQAGPTTSAQDELQGLLVGLTLLTLVPVMNVCVAEMQVVRQRGVLSSSILFVGLSVGQCSSPRPHSLTSVVDTSRSSSAPASKQEECFAPLLFHHVDDDHTHDENRKLLCTS